MGAASHMNSLTSQLKTQGDMIRAQGDQLAAWIKKNNRDVN